MLAITEQHIYSSPNQLLVIRDMQGIALGEPLLLCFFKCLILINLYYNKILQCTNLSIIAMEIELLNRIINGQLQPCSALHRAGLWSSHRSGPCLWPVHIVCPGHCVLHIGNLSTALHRLLHAHVRMYVHV